MRLWGHILMDTGVLVLALGIPFLSSDKGRAMLSGDLDAVSSASAIIAQPSGNYLVLINSEKHENAENLALWEEFFTGDDSPVIFEDISCLTALSDSGGRTMADSFRSSLPENQMTVSAIDSTLLCSKAEHGLFDVIILSAEAADACTAETFCGKDTVTVLQIAGAAE